MVWALATSCASLHSVSLTSVPANRSHPLQEEVSDWAFLGIHFSNDFVNELRDRLHSACHGGKVSGILTKYESYNYFLVIKRQVKATAFCETKAG